MFVNCVEYPAINEGMDKEFREWFAWSNETYSKFPGFIARRLCLPISGEGNYMVIIEHESEETWNAMHGSSEVAVVREKSIPMFMGGKSPEPHYYKTVI